jgi:hypothetical protein
MAYIDVKVTNWTRYKLTEDVDIKEVESFLKKGYSVDDTINEMNLSYGEDNNGVYYTMLDDTEGQITLEENSGFSTIELYNDDNSKIWANGK